MMDFVKENSAIAIFYTIYTSRQSTHTCNSFNIQNKHTSFACLCNYSSVCDNGCINQCCVSDQDVAMFSSKFTITEMKFPLQVIGVPNIMLVKPVENPEIENHI